MYVHTVHTSVVKLMYSSVLPCFTYVCTRCTYACGKTNVFISFTRVLCTRDTYMCSITYVFWFGFFSSGYAKMNIRLIVNADNTRNGTSLVDTTSIYIACSFLPSQF